MTWMFPQIGDRVVLGESCPWPERVGLTGVVVAPPANGTYPQPAKWEVLVLLDDDPLAHRIGRGWSCALSAKSCTVIA